MSFAECRKENIAGENGECVGAGEGSLVPASAGQIRSRADAVPSEPNCG